MSKVSIIIPCYKQAHFLPETLESVIAQTHADWECIIINDGSPDNTAEVAEEYARRDGRIRHIAQENRGLSGARNHGLDEAKGDWIQFLDSDDIILPEKLKKQLAALGPGNHFAVSYCDYYFCSEDDVNKRLVKGHDYEHPRIDSTDPVLDMILRWETDLSIPPHAFLFSADIFSQRAIRFDEKLPNHEDWECWTRIMLDRPNLLPVHEELVAYRQHATSMSANKIPMWHGYRQALLQFQQNFGSDVRIRRAVNIKLRQIRSLYLGENATMLTKLSAKLGRVYCRLKSFLMRAYCRYIPWPLQRLVQYLFR